MQWHAGLPSRVQRKCARLLHDIHTLESVGRKPERIGGNFNASPVSKQCQSGVRPTPFLLYRIPLDRDDHFVRRLRPNRSVFSPACPKLLKVLSLGFYKTIPVSREPRCHQRFGSRREGRVPVCTPNEFSLLLGPLQVSENPMLQHPTPGARVELPKTLFRLMPPNPGGINHSPRQRFQLSWRRGKNRAVQQIQVGLSPHVGLRRAVLHRHALIHKCADLCSNVVPRPSQ